ncbi:hypothetical protein [Arthrobacter tecti]
MASGRGVLGELGGPLLGDSLAGGDLGALRRRICTLTKLLAARTEG